MNYFLAQALNNLWANHRLLAACEGLSDTDYKAPRCGFFPSIQHTLCHILDVDDYYLAALSGDLAGQSAPSCPSRTFLELAALQRTTDRLLVRFCAGVVGERAAQTVRLDRADGICEERIDRLLLHLFEHQIHHRGQVHAMLSGTPVAPPQLDEFFLEADGRLREEDMRVLGLNEADIWP
ncbi:DinB family protein [Xanthomonas sp. WHRI 1810A]|uniref:DinB family protein n=1 Tax=Xanthomonas sp. WHRI 1810A TaxID=3161565 RepID=UPI0032E8AED4